MTKEEETFEEFFKSFFYGKRSDMNFKFLAGLSDEQAADFLQGLLWKLGDALDTANFDEVIQHIITGQSLGYSKPGRFAYEEGAVMILNRPMYEVKLGLLTTTGHYVHGQDPRPFGVENMTQQEAEERIMEFVRGDPQLIGIPIDTPLDDLRVRHGGYDVRGVQADPNTAFPISRLAELQREGFIGSLTDFAWSFVGACSQMRLIKRFLPKWVEEIKQTGLDALLLVPV